MHVDLEVTLRSRDLRSNVGLDLMRSSNTYFNAYQRDNLDGSVIFALAILVLAKNCRSCPSVSNAVYRLSLNCFVSEITGGGGTNLAQTPVGAQVKVYVCRL